MSGRRRYVPILKGKQGELNALRQLYPDDMFPTLSPMVEAIDGSTGDERDREALVESVVRKLSQAWPAPGRPPLMVDAADLEPEEPDGQGPVIRELVDRLVAWRVDVVPVVRLTDPAETFEALRESCARDGYGAAIRVTPDDLDDSILPLDRLIEARVADLGITEPGLVDLVLDFGTVADDNALAIAARLGRFIVGDLVRQRWRTAAVAAGAFPSDLSGVQAHTLGVLPRHDKALWQRLASLQVDRALDFADYAVSNPLLPVGGAFAAPPQLRYTVDESWLVMKGRRQDRRGHAQFFDICRAILDHEGERFDPEWSWGDGYIRDAAASVDPPPRTGPGNASTWRAIATSHHMAWVVRSLRERDEP